MLRNVQKVLIFLGLMEDAERVEKRYQEIVAKNGVSIAEVRLADRLLNRYWIVSYFVFLPLAATFLTIAIMGGDGTFPFLYPPVLRIGAAILGVLSNVAVWKLLGMAHALNRKYGLYWSINVIN